MPRLNEQALRRIDFSDGPRIELADGQSWTFPKPWLRFHAKRGSDGKIGIGGGLTYGSNYNEMLDRYAVLDKDDIFAKLELQIEMAATLLIQNYDLTDQEIESLLVIEPDNDSNMEMWMNGICPVILGLTPKPSADGSGTLSSQTG